MQLTRGSVRVLHQIFRLQRHDVRASPEAIAAALLESLAAVDQALRELERAGLVGGALGPRLTFTGLALAAAVAPRSAERASEKPAPRPEPRLTPTPIAKARPRAAYPVRRRGAAVASRPTPTLATRPLARQPLVLVRSDGPSPY